VERTRELAIAAEDAARHVDLVDAGVPLTGRDPVVRRVLGGDDANAVSGASSGAQRAPDAFLQPVFVAPQAMSSAKAGINRTLVLRILLCDRFLEELLE